MGLAASRRGGSIWLGVGVGLGGRDSFEAGRLHICGGESASPSELWFGWLWLHEAKL